MRDHCSLTVATACSAFAVLLIVSPARATDCHALIKSFLGLQPDFTYITVTMATLNANGLVTFSASTVHYLPGLTREINRQRITFPGHFITLTEPGEFAPDLPKVDFGKGVQLFSDRCPGGALRSGPLQAPGGSGAKSGCQPFDINQADDLAIEITDTTPVSVTITLRSWNNGKVTFEPTCDGPLMLGSTPDAKYILHLGKP